MNQIRIQGGNQKNCCNATPDPDATNLCVLCVSVVKTADFEIEYRISGLLSSLLRHSGGNALEASGDCSGGTGALSVSDDA
jgi:hypothetical protein